MTASARATRSSGGWTDDAVETLTRLWPQGDLSAAVIARRLGVTRNAVLGKIHRLGLSQPRRPRPSPVTPAPCLAKPRPLASPTHRASPRRDPAAAPTPPPKSVVETEPGLVARLEDLPARACHWPLGDPQTADFAFCGRRAETGPYCPAHADRAYRGRAVDVAELARLLRR